MLAPVFQSNATMESHRSVDTDRGLFPSKQDRADVRDECEGRTRRLLPGMKAPRAPSELRLPRMHFIYEQFDIFDGGFRKYTMPQVENMSQSAACSRQYFPSFSTQIFSIH